MVSVGGDFNLLKPPQATSLSQTGGVGGGDSDGRTYIMAAGSTSSILQFVWLDAATVRDYAVSR